MTSRWVSFDCYGTLVDWLSGFSLILEPVAGKLTGKLLDAYHHHERLVETERPLRSYKEVLALSLSRGASELGLALTEAEANVLSKEWHRLPVFEDVEPMLAELRSAGWKLAVLTNCDEDLFATTRNRLPVPFDAWVTAEEVRGYKPELAHFRRFAEKTGVTRADWIHVANSWVLDILPSARMGLRCVWVDRDLTGHPAKLADRRITSMRRLPEAVMDVNAFPPRGQ